MSKKFFIGLLPSLFLLAVFLIASPVTPAQYYSACSPQIDVCGPQMQYDYAPYADYAEYAAPTYGNHVFYGRLESVFWNLEGDNNRALIMRDIGGSNRAIFKSDDVDYGVTGAPRVVLGLNVTPYTSFEGVYMGFHHIQTYDEFEGDRTLSLAGDLPTGASDFFYADLMGVSSEADLHSAEFNIVRRTGVPYISWLAGFRYINFQEKFDLISIPYSNLSQYGEYRIRTKNELYGGQIGVKSEIPLSDRLGLQFLGKVGVFANSARQSSRMYDTELGARGTGKKSSETSFVGDVNIGGYIKISENVQIVGGYNFLWITEIARGADQLDFTFLANSGRFLRTDTAFLHGANVGVEMRF